jgi:hypothetical protein
MKSDAFRATVVAILVVVAVVWGIMQIPGPAKHVLPPLPPHMLVMPNEQFLVAPGYGAYGEIVCGEGWYSIKPGNLAFGGWWILSCHEYAHNLRYPKSKVWSYANSP